MTPFLSFRRFALLRAAAVAAALLLPAFPALADEETGGDALAPFLENYYAGVERRTLPSGLEVIVKEKHAAPVVTVQAWIRAGSIHEGNRLGSGLSHLLEHMLFDGTDEVRGRDGAILFPAYERGDVRRRAHDMGGHADAYTSQDRTVFYCTVLARHGREALRMIGHLVMHATLDPAILAEEIKTLAHEAGRDADNPAKVFRQRVYETVYRTHPVRIPVMGYRDLLEKLTREDLLDYYRERYIPNNMALVVAGDVDAGEVFAWAEEAFGGRDGESAFRRRATPSFVLPPEPRRNSPAVDLFEHPGTAAIAGQIAFQTIGIHHPDLYALDILADILGRTRSSVLYRKLVTDDPGGGVLSLKAGHNTPLFRGRFYVTFGLRPSVSLEEFREKLLSEMELYRREPVDADAIARAADRIGGRIVRSLSKVDRIGTNLGKTWLNALPHRFDLLYLENLRRVTPEEVLNVAVRYLDPESMILVAMGPEGFAGGTRGKDGTRGPRVDAPVLHRLSNGIPVLLERNEEFPVAVLHAALSGGTRYETPATNGSFRMLSSLCRLGTDSFDRAELDRICGEKGIEIAAGSWDNTFSQTVTVMAGDFPLGCTLFHELLCRPTFPSREVERVREEAILGVRRAAKHPGSVALAALRREIFGNHPSAMTPAGTERSLREIGAESLEAMRKEAVVPGGVAIAVVGRFDPDAALARLEELFGDLAGDAPTVAVAAPTPPAGRKVRTITLPAIGQTEVVVGFPGLAYCDPDSRILPLVTTVLNQRLLDNLRIRRGLIYTAQVYTLSGFDGGMVWIRSDTREADRAGEIVDGVLEEIERLRSELLDSGELEGARNALRARVAFGREDPATTAANLALELLYGMHGAAEAGPIDFIETIAADDVRRVARRVLTPDRCRSVIVKPD